jgi:hypothetical protein
MPEPLSQRLRKHLDGPHVYMPGAEFESPERRAAVPLGLLGEAIGALSVHERTPAPPAIATLEQRLNRLVDLIEKGDRERAEMCAAHGLRKHPDMPEFVRRRLSSLLDKLRRCEPPANCLALVTEARDYLRSPERPESYPLHKRFDTIAVMASQGSRSSVNKCLRYAEQYHPDMPQGARDAIRLIRSELSDRPVDWDCIVHIARQASRELERAAESCGGCGSAAAQAGTAAHLFAEATPSEMAAMKFNAELVSENGRLADEVKKLRLDRAECESTISSLQCRGSHLERQVSDLQAKLSTGVSFALGRFDALPRYESSTFSGMNTKPEGNYVYRDDARQVLLDMKAHLGTGGALKSAKEIKLRDVLRQINELVRPHAYDDGSIASRIRTLIADTLKKD